MMEKEQTDYSKLSYKLTKDLKKDDKKNCGIYFTPPKTIISNLEKLEPYFVNIKNVLEPSCGSCEYILKINEKYPEIEITGIEYNKTIYGKIKDLENENIRIVNDDYLKFESDDKYDLIIGNPPYFVMKKEDVSKEYKEYFDGRPNIFILFIIKSMKKLNENGILSFILPKSFTNCQYYDKTRKFICENFTIINVEECNDDYIETQQETICMIIQNKSPTNDINKQYTMEVDKYTIFGSPNNIKSINLLYQGSTSLFKLGFNVNVGKVVWNQVKDKLTNDSTKTRLIYNSDIVNNKLVLKPYKNEAKKNFIDKKGQTHPLLVVNRGYGVGDYNFGYCLIEGGEEYLVENHLICINPQKKKTNRELINLYNKIINSLNNEKTNEFIKLYFGNGAINTTELNFILPIYNM